MGLIDIDDRDTIIYNQGAEGAVTTPKAISDKFKEWQTMLKNELPSNSKVNHMGGGRYRLEIPYIECTGSDVETLLNVPFMHQLLKMELKHTDSSFVDAASPLTYKLYQRFNANTWAIMMLISNSIASDMTDEYIDYYKLRGEYKLLTNTTATDRILVTLYIRITGE